MLHSRRENGFRPGAASDTDHSHRSDFRFLRDNVMARAQPSGDHRTIALPAWKSRQMEIMRRGIRRTDQRSIPGHWRHRPGIYNRFIAQLGNYFGHGDLFLVAAMGVPLKPAWLGAGPRADTDAAFETPLTTSMAASAILI